MVDDGGADAAVPLHHLHVHIHDLRLGLDRHLRNQGSQIVPFFTGRFGNLDVEGEGVGVVLPDGGEGGVGDGIIGEVVDQDLGGYSAVS